MIKTSSLITAVSILTALSSILYSFKERNASIKQLKVLPDYSSVDFNNNNKAEKEVVGIFKETELGEIYAEQFSRNRKFFGDEGQDNIENSFVVVVGCGGVGSHAANMLLRAGVAKLRLIDFDNVSVSSLNRHAVATHDDVGTAKVSACAAHFKRINPKCRVEAINDMFEASIADYLLGGSPDYVIDAIDNLDTKAQLLEYCLLNNIKVIASGGAGGKADPSFLHFADIGEVDGDELISAIRKQLRKNLKGSSDIVGKYSIPVCYSKEKPRVKLLPLDEHQLDDPQQYASIQRFRVRIMPVLGPIPAAFGNALASYVLSDLANIPIDYSKEFNLSYNSVLKLKHQFEKRINVPDLGFHTADLEEITALFFRGRCIISGSKLRPQYVLWDPNHGYHGSCDISNIVLMSSEEATRHMKLFNDNKDIHPKDVYSPALIAKIETLRAKIDAHYNTSQPSKNLVN